MALTLSDMLEGQQRAFLAAMPEANAARIDRLRRLIALVTDHAEAIVAAVSDDFGHRSCEETLMSDVVSTIGACRHAIRNLDRWSRSERRPLPFPLGLLGGRGWVQYQPKGVVGVIAPWNFPVQLSLAPAAGAFAAGNRCMVKMSEHTPRTAALLGEIVPTRFAADELVMVGGNTDVGRAFAALPFDHLLFTGSTEVGRHILAAAAQNLTPVTLELGGKSPAIVGRGADLARAAERVAMGKMLNAGQICLAPDYALVAEEQEEAFVALVREAAARLYPTIFDNPDYTSIVDDRHRSRLEAWLDDARDKGAEVIAVNPAGEDGRAAGSNKLPLHIVRWPTEDMTVMRQEIFGPLLPVKTYRHIDDAIAYVNGRDRPLGLYHFGDEGERRTVISRTISGGVTLDDVFFHAGMDDLPFGGIGASGMGAYHGVEGFRTFSHARAIYRQPRIDVGRLGGLLPPFGAKTRKTIERMMK